MNKRCPCGDLQQLRLRTVVYARKVSITKVPVFSCSRCGSSEVHAGVKSEIGRLIGRLGSRPVSRIIPFDQINELAGVLASALENGSDRLLAADIARAAEERTNELLDLWLIASSLKDEAWKAEIRERLAQLSSTCLTS